MSAISCIMTGCFTAVLEMCGVINRYPEMAGVARARAKQGIAGIRRLDLSREAAQGSLCFPREAAGRAAGHCFEQLPGFRGCRRFECRLASHRTQLIVLGGVSASFTHSSSRRRRVSRGQRIPQLLLQRRQHVLAVLLQGVLVCCRTA